MLYRNSISINFVSILKFEFASLLLKFKTYFLIPAMVTICDISDLIIFFTVHMVLHYEKEKGLYFYLLGLIPNIAKETFSSLKHLFFS